MCKEKDSFLVKSSIFLTISRLLIGAAGLFPGNMVGNYLVNSVLAEIYFLVSSVHL